MKFTGQKTSRVKKPKSKTKPRKYHLSVKDNILLSGDHLHLRLTDGHVSISKEGKPHPFDFAGSHLDVYYDRPSKKKVVLKLPITTKDFALSPSAFLNYYDVLFAVDTNSRDFDGAVHSISAMCRLEIHSVTRELSGLTSKFTCNLNMFGALIYAKNIRERIENWCWVKAIEAIQSLYPKFNSSLRVGLVVDSDLGKIEAYNQRTEPIHGNFYLPNNFWLIYASADASSNHLFHRMIRLCDREATLQLEAFTKTKKLSKVFTQLNSSSTEHIGPYVLGEHPPDRPKS